MNRDQKINEIAKCMLKWCKKAGLKVDLDHMKPQAELALTAIEKCLPKNRLYVCMIDKKPLLFKQRSSDEFPRVLSVYKSGGNFSFITESGEMMLLPYGQVMDE